MTLLTGLRSILLSLVALGALSFAVIHLIAPVSRPVSPKGPPTAAISRMPSLYCDFYDFMHASVVMSFDFAVQLGKGTAPLFRERFETGQDGTRTTFDSANQPAWIYSIEDGTPAITAPDSATRIMLYGLKPQTAGVFWTEAGVRSDQYRNLEGKCRQAFFGGKAVPTTQPGMNGEERQ